MNPLSPAAWFLLATFLIAFLLLIAGSPPHRDDPLFWYVCAAVVGLVWLSANLRTEKQEDERALFVRVFFKVYWLLAVLLAACVIWKSIRAGRLW